MSRENDVLPNRPVAGSVNPLFSPARDILPRAPSMVRNSDELLRIPDRQGAQEDVVHQAEDGGVRADAERERQQRDGAEARGLDELTEGEFQVGHGNLDGKPSPRVGGSGYPNASILIFSRATPSDVR